MNERDVDPTKTRQSLVEAARKMIPTLRERAPRAEALRSLPPETVEDLRAAGLFRVTSPKRFGGFELGPDVVFDIAVELGQGCGSTAWAWVICATSGAWLTHYPEQTQQEFWKDGPDSCAAGGITQNGGATPVDGGFQLNGSFPYSSGVNHTNWAALWAIIFDEEQGGRPDMGIFLVPKGEYKVIDDWRAAGLRATGSNSVVVENVFVPTRRMIPFRLLREGGGKETEQYPGYTYRFPFAGAAPISFPAVGIAKGALQYWIDWNRSRMAITGKAVAEQGHTQVRLSESTVEIECAELLIRRNLQRTIDIISSGRSLSVEERSEHLRDSSYAVNLCVRAVDRLVLAAGASGILEESPLQRAFRDIHAASSHISFRWEHAAEHYAKIKFGIPHGNPFFY